MRNKPHNPAGGNCALAPIVNYTAADGTTGTLYPLYSDTIEATEPHIRAAVAQAKSLGSDVAVVFVAADGHAVSRWRVPA